MLRRAPKRSERLRFGPQILDGIHYVHLLVNKRVAQLDGPLEVCIHVLNDGGEFGHHLDVVIPGLIIDLAHVVRVLNETRRLHNFKRIGGSRQYHGQKGVRVKGDRCHEFFEVVFAQLCGSRRRGDRLFLCAHPLRYPTHSNERNRNQPQ